MAISITNAGAFLKDKDGNVGKVVGLSANDVTLVNNTISSVAGLDTRVTDAVNSIASVKETADAAKTAADAAKTAADSAKTAADEAKSTADSAKTTANSAFATASQADATATQAQTAAAKANSAVQTVDSAWKAAKVEVDTTLTSQQTQIESAADTANSAEGTATAMSNLMTEVYWPLIQKNQYMVSTVAMEKKDESTGATTYWPIYATASTYGSTRLMQYDEDSELNNEVVTRALYTALEARVKALESKSSN